MTKMTEMLMNLNVMSGVMNRSGLLGWLYDIIHSDTEM